MGVVIVLLGSIIYKQQRIILFHHFPVPKNLEKESKNASLYLFLFFSKNDCVTCIKEFVEVLNTLPAQFYSIGIVPDEELKEESQLRRSIGVSFPLFGMHKYKRYLPYRTPTVFCVSLSGKIIFVLPGIEGQSIYLKNILTALYWEIQHSSGQEKNFLNINNKK